MPQNLSQHFRELYHLLAAQLPTGHWWPAETDFEIAVGAILTQNTAWSNVEKAIARLRQEHRLTPEGIAAADPQELAGWIRPAGYFTTKAGYLRTISEWFLTRHDHALQTPTDALRAALLELRGVGSETADSLLLYVYHRPVFIYDLYARRLLQAAGMGAFAQYESARRALDSAVAACRFSVAELREFHGLIVDAGKIARTLGGWESAYPRLLAGTLTHKEGPA